MNIQIITSSYPAYTGDPGGTAGLFVQSFTKELANQGHRVIVQPVARKKHYQENQKNIIIEPLPWQGKDQELASMNYFNLKNFSILWNFFIEGRKKTLEVYQKYNIDRILCMWIIPCGIFGYWLNKKTNAKYDVWALGSDVWKIKKIPILGNFWIKKVASKANGIFADGHQLAKDVKEITKKTCTFMPSMRKLPSAEKNFPSLEPKDKVHLLYVGRYHGNKGPDLLIEAISYLPADIKKKIHLHMFGEGPLENDLRQSISHYDLKEIISFEGPIDAQNFSNYLSRTHFLVIPSRIESIPLVFSDAMQIGIPIIAMPVGDLQELILKYQCGIVANQSTAGDLSSAIETAVLKNNREFIQNIQLRQTDFDMHNIVQQWLDSGSTN